MTIHIILQAQCGVGKSFIASIVSQYLLEGKKQKTVCIDTNLNNATLYENKELKAKYLKIIDRDSINSIEFDKLVEIIMNDIKSNFVIDSSATTCLLLIEYLKKTGIVTLLKESFNIVFHIPIVGGPAQATTISVFVQLVNMFDDVDNFVAWINPYYGRLHIELNDKSSSTDFEDHPDIKELNKDEKGSKIIQVNMPLVNKDLAGKDLEQMTKANFTFNQVLNSGDFNVVAKSRLKKYRDDMFVSLKEFM